MTTTLLLAAALATTSADAKPAEPQAPDTIIAATKSGRISTDPLDKRWAKAAPMEVVLSAQRTVELRDLDANEIAKAKGPMTATVRVLYGKEQLGILVQWADAAKDEINLEDGAYGDAIALSLPVVFGPGVPLPYLGMGDIAHPVVIASKRANAHAVQERQFIAAGFGSLQPIDRNTDMSMTYDEASKSWTAVFVRPYTDGNLDLADAAVIPFSLAIWDGSDLERGGYKAIMRWHALHRSKMDADAGYVAALQWGEDGRSIGDPEHGEELVGQLCVACHHVGDKAIAMPELAPNLNNIGLQASASYIKQSITDPSAVVVRSPNPNRHYTKAGGKDERGGYPINPMYQWYTVGEDGELTSKMPRYAHLTDADVDDIVAYLKTIGADTATPAAPRTASHASIGPE